MEHRDLKIIETEGGYLIKVYGRANFNYGMSLRNFARNLTGDFGQVCIDLKACEAMDSTFMGTLAMLGLKGTKLNRQVEILNASEFCRGLLRGLGLNRLFKFENREAPDSGEIVSDLKSADLKMDTAETVVEAHKTLVEADSDNAAKFGAVIDYAEKDLQKLKDQNQQDS
ncbi:MAG: hypothetical protein PHV75_00135 [Victivallaceae bacterium]|jgi:hypothetical protein|nr:hypothetical protein [Victivallaceae bacterium]NLK82577.1 hypothetical protein [Lentisphaerota bacterium]